MSTQNMEVFDDVTDEEPSQCTGECKGMCGENWAYSGTAYGGYDKRYYGEGHCYCMFCGADGDA